MHYFNVKPVKYDLNVIEYSKKKFLYDFVKVEKDDTTYHSKKSTTEQHNN